MRNSQVQIRFRFPKTVQHAMLFLSDGNPIAKRCDQTTIPPIDFTHSKASTFDA